jgi:hypothetical protein
MGLCERHHAGLQPPSGKPTDSAYVESFNATVRLEVLGCAQLGLEKDQRAGPTWGAVHFCLDSIRPWMKVGSGHGEEATPAV